MKRVSLVKKAMGMGLIASLLCVCAPKVQAQDDMTRVRFGVKGGLNFSTLSLEDVNDKKTKIGFHGGLFAKVPVNEVFAIQP